MSRDHKKSTNLTINIGKEKSMKLYIISFVMLLSLSFCGYGENISQEVFFLKAEGSGEKYGPFECKDGEKIIIGKQTYVINKLVTMVKKNDLQAKMERIIMPTADFREANIQDVIKYISQQSIVLDKESPEGKKGVNILLHLSRDPKETQNQMPNVTLTLRNISVRDVIKYITEVTNLKYRIEENAVVIESKTANNTAENTEK